MLVLNYPSIWFVVTGVVHHSITLEVRSVLHASLEADGTPVEFTLLIVEILIYGTCIYELIGMLFPFLVL